MSNRNAELISLFQTEIYSICARLLDDQDKALLMDGAREWLCTCCGGPYPRTVASCPNPGCHSERRMSRPCGAISRRSQYHELLAKHKLWPSAAVFRSKSLCEILEIVRLIENDHGRCGMGKCPLTKHLESLSAALVAIMKKSQPRREVVRASLRSVPRPW